MLFRVSLTSAIPAVYNGVGPQLYGPEELIKDFAILTDSRLEDVPSAFTICSSLSTKAFSGGVSPFQLLHKDGKSWISVHFRPAAKEATFHHLVLTVREAYRTPTDVICEQ